MPESGGAADLGRHVRVAVVGAGFGGLCAAVRLRQSGIEDFVVLEKGDSIGGTWRDNTYPGCTCDVPSLLYSFSFAPNPRWTRSFSQQPEILRYLERCADEFGIRPHVRLQCEVVSASWDDTVPGWRIETTTGSWTADVLVAAPGPLHEPVVPDLPGLADFEGAVLHSARWDHTLDLRGRNVAVVGTGASAVQIVPAIAPEVAHLMVVQRTPPWVLPRRDRALSAREHRLYTRLPVAQRFARRAIGWARELLVLGLQHPRLQGWQERLALHHLARCVPDPALRTALTPNYRIGCKRILLSSTYWPTLTRSNVELVASAVTRVLPHGFVTSDGREHRADTLVFATGFHVTDPPIAGRVRGRDGRTLAEVWHGSPQAYLGTTVVGFPNLFLLLGPNTGLGHSSVVLMVEAQVEHLLAALRHLDDNDAAALEPTPAAQDGFVAEMDRRMHGTVWEAGGCASWYRDRTGRVSALWPGSVWSFQRRLGRLVPADYALSGKRCCPAPQTAVPQAERSTKSA